ncbi:MAG: helix-turn-helix transcriptional regulator [Gammaproteobacteria bacterium]|nr:helix-turn-helix transcriptional regulator [Gammaproteobacteria bacterium]
MKKSKQKKLESSGWKVGTTSDFLNLSQEEAAYIELKLSLSESLKSHRQGKKISQVELAKLIQSSQSRIAKMEAGDPSVSVDLLIKSLLALGVSRRDLAKVISH